LGFITKIALNPCWQCLTCRRC